MKGKEQMSKRICKGCKKEIRMVLIENHKAPLQIFPKERLNYCDECWEKK